jgi:hypothetical protein
LTDYAGPAQPDSSADEPPLLALEGLWQMAQFIAQRPPSQVRGADEI